MSTQKTVPCDLRNAIGSLSLWSFGDVRLAAESRPALAVREAGATLVDEVLPASPGDFE